MSLRRLGVSLGDAAGTTAKRFRFSYQRGYAVGFRQAPLTHLEEQCARVGPAKEGAMKTCSLVHLLALVMLLSPLPAPVDASENIGLIFFGQGASSHREPASFPS